MVFLLLQVIERMFLRKTFTLLEEIERMFHLKKHEIIMVIKVTLGLFYMLGISMFLMISWHRRLGHLHFDVINRIVSKKSSGWST